MEKITTTVVDLRVTNDFEDWGIDFEISNDGSLDIFASSDDGEAEIKLSPTAVEALRTLLNKGKV